MKLTVISLFLIILPSVSALSFDFVSPGSVSINENFSVSISAASSDNYDVKLFVQDNETKTIISEIYNEGWKNPFYYIKSAFPSQSNFIARATNVSDKAVVCVRLRKTGGSSYTEKCKAIDISGSPSFEPYSESNTASDEEPQETVSPINDEARIDFVPAAKEPEQLPTDSPREVIHLSAKSSEETFVTGKEKIRLYAVYAFTLLVSLLVIFLIFKKL